HQLQAFRAVPLIDVEPVRQLDAAVGAHHRRILVVEMPEGDRLAGGAGAVVHFEAEMALAEYARRPHPETSVEQRLGKRLAPRTSLAQQARDFQRTLGRAQLAV